MLALSRPSSIFAYMPFEHAKLPELGGEYDYVRLGRLRGAYLLRRTRFLMTSLKSGEYDSDESFYCGNVEVYNGYKFADIWEFDDHEGMIGHTQVAMVQPQGKRTSISASHVAICGTESHLYLDNRSSAATDLVVGREVVAALSGLAREKATS